MGNGAILGKNNNKNCSIPQQFWVFFFFFPHIEINESPMEDHLQKMVDRKR